MIIETLISLAVNLFSGLIDLCDFVSLPLDLINVLGTICGYGSFIIGSDVLLLFSGCITFWLGFKMSVGLAKFIWDLLPLT